MKIQNLKEFARKNFLTGLVALTALSLPSMCNGGCATYGAQVRESEVNYAQTSQISQTAQMTNYQMTR